MLALSVSHALAHTSQQAKPSPDGSMPDHTLLLKFDGPSKLEQAMTAISAVERMHQMQCKMIDNLYKAREDIQKMGNELFALMLGAQESSKHMQDGVALVCVHAVKGRALPCWVCVQLITSVQARG